MPATNGQVVARMQQMFAVCFSTRRVVAFAAAMLLWFPNPVFAYKYVDSSTSPIQQATQAEIVVIGKVADIEPDLLMVEINPGAAKATFSVANVQIHESLLGAKGVTHVRVAFTSNGQLPYTNPNFRGGARRLRRPNYRPNVNGLVEGQEACFLLQKLHGTDCYTLTGPQLDASDPNYLNELKGMKKVLKAISHPMEVLQSNESGDRQLAACALLLHYKGNQSTVPAIKTEAIPAEQSKLILQAIGEMKWGELPFDQNGVLSLQNVFWLLEASDKNGWKQPQQKEDEDYNAVMTEAIGKWVKENSGKFQIQRPAAKSGH